MFIHNLKLQNYRNFETLNLSFNPTLNIFIGNNAQGKTNILESIYILGMTKSFLTISDKSLIRFGENGFFISGDFKINNRKKNFQVSMHDDIKQLKINQKIIHKMTDYISFIHIVVFSPNDLKLIKYNPQIRRRFINMELSQIDNNYVKLMNEYNTILKKRNDYLKQWKMGSTCNELYFNILNNRYIELASSIYEKRKHFFDLLNRDIGKIFYEIMGMDGLVIEYITTITPSEWSFSEIKNSLKSKIENNLAREKNYGISLYGPHRDDFLFYLNDLDMSIYCSQGQQRIAVLSLKLAEISIMKKMTGESPIVLLDDIFSELDLEKQNKLIQYIHNDIQTIITTTDLNKIDSFILKNARIFKVKNGKVEEKKK